MDENRNAKVSDFGLAKLMKPDETKTFTGIRGMRGYVAPVWHQKLPVTVKADVYSFGVEEVEAKQLERIIKVALWCILDEPSLRHSMKKVLLMLEGTVDIPTPPNPTSFISTI
ncbi:hypothetical protein JRO89_XS08G0062800 [Xanthoceras sorbifolium]|uniref:Protein kinase domain-containing protein n=1 Tax=Xanthoceras sorbifolium TaxID=99658 RepID=A0ABQ8HNT4_9ROSI|nr:hypothetical protein JRO89_XS08G0062800 [Xanthoceras sorbifolium]